MSNRPVKLGFLVSGQGSNLRAIVERCKDGRLNATPVVVIAHRTDIPALEYARDNSIPACCVYEKTHNTPTACDSAITERLKQYDVDWVILAGYIKKVGSTLLGTFQNRVFNIHPSLLPRHGGVGMYGRHVHQAVLDAGDKKTGVTVHLVNEAYDQGRILAQTSVAVQPDDTSESLAARVLKVEHVLYAATLQKIICKKLPLPPAGCGAH